MRDGTRDVGYRGGRELPAGVSPGGRIERRVVNLRIGIDLGHRQASFGLSAAATTAKLVPPTGDREEYPGVDHPGPRAGVGPSDGVESRHRPASYAQLADAGNLNLKRAGKASSRHLVDEVPNPLLLLRRVGDRESASSGDRAERVMPCSQHQSCAGMTDVIATTAARRRAPHRMPVIVGTPGHDVASLAGFRLPISCNVLSTPVCCLPRLGVSRRRWYRRPNTPSRY